MINAQERSYPKTFEEIAKALPELLEQLKATQKRFDLKT